MSSRLKEDYVLYGRSLRNRAFWAICVFHFGVWSLKRRFKVTRWLTSKLYGLAQVFVGMCCGIELDRHTRIGKGFHIVHPGGISIHPQAVFGDRCGLMHGVTIGTNMERGGVPTIGNDVFIGCYSSILGPVQIGDGARISANTLVITDVPPGGVAIGVPAKVFPRLTAMKPAGEKPAGGAQASADRPGGAA